MKRGGWRRSSIGPMARRAMGPIVFVAQPQASRVAEEVACSSSGLSRDETNVRVGLYLMEA